jgi:hypothetical protein
MTRLKTKVKEYLNNKISDEQMLNYYWRTIWHESVNNITKQTEKEDAEMMELFYVFEDYSFPFSDQEDDVDTASMGKSSFDRNLLQWYEYSEGIRDEYFMNYEIIMDCANVFVDYRKDDVYSQISVVSDLDNILADKLFIAAKRIKVVINNIKANGVYIIKQNNNYKIKIINYNISSKPNNYILYAEYKRAKY